VLRLLVNIEFQVLFHSPSGVLFTFPSRYCFTIGHHLVFSLGRWSSLLPTRFHVSRGTLDTGQSSFLSCTGLLPSMVVLSNTLLLETQNHYASPQPHTTYVVWFGLLRVRSPLLTESLFVLFSCRYLDVSVPYVSLLHTMYLCTSTWALTPSGFPHSDIYGSNGYLRLPVAFRSLSRPSSAYGAKAFTLCS
jgi:hypothetical protein